jgi:ribosomal protein L18
MTETDVIAEIIYSEAGSTRTVNEATTQELPGYGITLDLTKYAAPCCVGMLVVRRFIQDLGLADVVAELGRDRPLFHMVFDDEPLFTLVKGAVDGDFGRITKISRPAAQLGTALARLRLPGRTQPQHPGRSCTLSPVEKSPTAGGPCSRTLRSDPHKLSPKKQ